MRGTIKMTYEEIYKNITDGKYNTQLPYPPYRPDKIERTKMQENDKVMREAYRKDDTRLQSIFALDLRDYINSKLRTSLTTEQWQAVWHKAWEDGHSSGYNEILMVVSDLIDIIKTFVGNK
jgi:hypothetical protein